MSRLWKIIHKFTATFMVAVSFLYVGTAEAGKITNLRIGQGIGSVRVVFDADSKFDYKVFTLSNPNRLVIDAQGVDISPAISKNKDSNVFVENVRVGTTGVDGIRIVFDLKKPALIKRAFMLYTCSSNNC